MTQPTIHPQFKADLLEAIEQFLESKADDKNFPELVTGELTAFYMTEAACAVLSACAESQEYGVSAGLFE